MKTKITKLIFWLLLILGIFLVYRSCTRIKYKELEILHNELKRSDRNIKQIKFYFRRPRDFCVRIVYNGEIDKRGILNIVTHFKKTITYEVRQKIGKTFSQRFILDGPFIYIYQDFVFADTPYLYQITIIPKKSSSKDENDITWNVRKNHIDPEHFNQRRKEYYSYINGFRLIIGGTILVPLLCFFFVRYWRRRC